MNYYPLDVMWLLLQQDHPGGRQCSQDKRQKRPSGQETVIIQWSSWWSRPLTDQFIAAVIGGHFDHNIQGRPLCTCGTSEGNLHSVLFTVFTR